MKIQVVLLLLLGCVSSVFASRGDRSYVFQLCKQRCTKSRCHGINSALYVDRNSVDVMVRTVGWTCEENCRYLCMWRTVDAFKHDKLPVPQFYGKWPFIRLLGMQEPASVIFSLFNLLTNVWMVIQFLLKVPSSVPTYNAWLFYSVAVCNAWFWSLVFHCRDTPFTEKMDYFGALSFLLCSLFALVVRRLSCGPDSVPSGQRLRLLLVCTGMILFFIGHTGYLSFVRFDYQYNMAVNLSVAASSSLGWCYWAWTSYKTRGLKHTQYAIITNVLLQLMALLELNDFAPWGWIFDAHALWHAGTVPLPLIWYRFIISDCLHLHETNGENIPLLPVKTDTDKPEEKTL